MPANVRCFKGRRLNLRIACVLICNFPVDSFRNGLMQIVS